MSHLETTFSFRTRILDYLWAGLPMVVTDGDSFAELVATEGLGIVVPAQDAAALESAIERVLYDEPFAAEVRANVERVREQFVWERTLAPLVEFVRAPRRAVDHAEARVDRSGGGRRRKPHGPAHDLRMLWHYLRAEGPGGVWRRVRGRLGKPW
jgi:hypothetical protein